MCPECVDIHLGIDININKCKTHGKDFIEWKCKFCCSVAQWFCWGNTHFCDPCHRKAYTVAKLPINKLP